MTRYETLDVTGLVLDGDKEIILNDFTLTLTGDLRVTDNLYLDVYPGEGLSGGGIDMSALRFDLSHMPQGLTARYRLWKFIPLRWSVCRSREMASWYMSLRLITSS